MADNQKGPNWTKLPCAIMSCDCKHEYQDEKYGRGKRVFNPGKTQYECTVCGKKRQK